MVSQLTKRDGITKEVTGAAEPHTDCPGCHGQEPTVLIGKTAAKGFDPRMETFYCTGCRQNFYIVPV
jgi:hypothetical protein